MNRSRILRTFVACCVALLTSTLSAAEEARPTVEQILVTAQKRSENVQDVPIAVTALVAELKQPTVRTLVDLNGYAPNVRIDRDPSRSGGASINIRGVSPTRTDDNSLDAPIAVEIDGIYLGTLSGQIIENFDLERVEILRGPQGTLFGKNTVGGVVSVIRSRPTGEWGGHFKYDMGKWNQQEFRGVANAPIIQDKLAAKVFYTNLQGDGYLVHTTPDANGNLVADNNHMPEQDYQNYGLTLLATPMDSFEALFTIEKFEDKSQGGGSLTNFNLAPGVAAKPPPGSPQTDLSGGFLSCTLFASHILPVWDSTVPCRTSLSTAKSTSVDTLNPSHYDVDAYTLNMTYDLNENFRLVSVTGYRDMTENRLLDFDGSSDDHITIERNNDFDQTSEELRLEGSWDNFSIVGGAYYWESKFTQDWITGGQFWKYVGSLSGYDLSNNTWLSPVAAAAYAPLSPLEACFAQLFGQVRCDTGATLAGLGPAYQQRLFETQKTTSYAYFAQGDWKFMENWTLTAGIRYTNEEKDFRAGQAYLAPVARQSIDNFPAYADLDNEWTKWSPKLGLAYQFTPDIMFYGSYSEGFHSGGFFGVNQNVSDFTRDQYKPEEMGSYEVGMKSQFFDNSVQLNVAGFYNEYTDKQESSVQLDTTTNTVATVFSNVADATYQGIEVEAQWVASDNLSLFATFGYLDASYDEFQTDINANDGIDKVEDASYLKPRNAPDYSYGVGGTFAYPIGPGHVEFFTKYSWVDEIETSLLNLDIGRVDSREDLSASIGYYYENVSVVLYGNNLTDETFEVPFPIVPLFASGNVTPGESWGLSFSIQL